jgi:hypothetical protein
VQQQLHVHVAADQPAGSSSHNSSSAKQQLCVLCTAMLVSTTMLE